VRSDIFFVNKFELEAGSCAKGAFFATNGRIWNRRHLGGFVVLVGSAFGLTFCFLGEKCRSLPIVFSCYLKKGKKQMFFVAVFKRDFIYLCGKIRKRSLRGASVGVFLWRIVSEKTTFGLF